MFKPYWPYDENDPFYEFMITVMNSAPLVKKKKSHWLIRKVNTTEAA